MGTNPLMLTEAQSERLERVKSSTKVIGLYKGQEPLFRTEQGRYMRMRPDGKMVPIGAEALKALFRVEIERR